MSRLKSHGFVILAACVALAGVPLTLGAVGVPFPGALPSLDAGFSQSHNTSAGQASNRDGRTLRITGIVADREQVAIGYEILGRPDDGQFQTITAPPRLVLTDGSPVRFIGNAATGNGGTFVFEGLPPGRTTAALEVDGALFEHAAATKQFSLPLNLDVSAAGARSELAITAGEGKASLSLTSVSRSASLIVVRGEFLGLTEAEIQQLGRPDVSLRTGADSVASESGRLGFGPGLRQFEFRFPATVEGSVTLVLTGFSDSSDGDGFPVSTEFPIP